MINIEKQLRDTRTGDMYHINEDEFLASLHSKVSESKDNRRTIITSLCMLMVVSLMTITQFGAPDSKINHYFVDSADNFLETDFWNIKSDSLDYNQDYYNNMAYFFLDEGYVWETIELLDQFKLNEEEL